MGGLPFRTQTAIRAEAAAAALAETNARLVVLREQRNKLLLEDNDSEAAKIAIEIAEAERLALGYVDKERLLREQDAREAHEKRLRENEAKNKRVDALFDLRSEDIAKLAALEKQRAKLWKALLATNRKIVAAHSWEPADLGACMLTPLAFNTGLAHESYRLSYTPLRYGGVVEAPDAGLSLPGSKCPRVEWALQPERISPMKDVFAEAGEYGKACLRGNAGTVVNGAPIANGVPQQAVAVPLDSNGEAAPAPDGGEPEPVQRTEAERKRGELWRRLQELGADPARKAEYDDAVAALVQVEAEIDAARKVETQGHGGRS